jgi:hypothetical protein
MTRMLRAFLFPNDDRARHAMLERYWKLGSDSMRSAYLFGVSK